MPNHKLLQLGYKPVTIVVLHDAGAIIKNTPTREDSAWWKQYPTCSKTLMLDGSSLKELAEMIGIEVRPLKCEGKNGQTHYQDLSLMDIPVGNLEIEETQDNHILVEKLFAKVENGVLHLAAAFKGGEFVFSSHGGSFDISWPDTADEEVGQ